MKPTVNRTNGAIFCGEGHMLKPPAAAPAHPDVIGIQAGQCMLSRDENGSGQPGERNKDSMACGWTRSPGDVHEE